MAEENKKTLRWISEEYYDLNGDHIDTFDTLPSSIEFSRLLRIARPVLIKDCPVPKAMARWTNEYIANACADAPISVAVTPNGRADAITRGPDDRLYFAEPCVEQMTMSELLARLKSSDQLAEVVYLQSQDGNLYSSSATIPSEYKKLLPDVPEHLEFCSEALGSMPEAVNIWVGNEKSVTSIHSDPYENIYCVIRGSKTFTVFPPTEGWCIEERIYPHATYERIGPNSELVLVSSEESAPPVRWSSITDPTDEASLPAGAHPITITVNAGESLYLPAGWWHYVRQSGLTVAVNYWYDMESRGMSWVWLNLLRGGASEAEPLPGNEGDEVFDDQDSD